MKMKIIIMLAIAAIVLVGCSSKNYDDFASCLDSNGVKFYGAFWCPHCQNQKALFGNSANLLPYIECATPDGKGQLQACIDQKIKNYPTWEFKDKSRLSGELSMQTLAQKSGCKLPK